MNSFTLGSLIALLGVSMVTTDAVSQSTLDRTKRPAEQPLPKIELPAIQKATLSNGLEVWLVEQHKLPMLSLNLVIQAGSDHDPLNKPGIATMTAEVMDAGTATDGCTADCRQAGLYRRFHVHPRRRGRHICKP